VDTTAGTVKLSRKILLDDDQINGPDRLEDLKLASDEDVVKLIGLEKPKFPVKPPRTWSKDFFK
jgi:hypothetical protein